MKMRNKKIIALLITSLLLLTAVTSIAVAKKPIKKRTIYVNDDFYHPNKPSDGSRARPYTTIQQGIDTANPDDTVFVFNGIYNENIVVNKTINLIGEDKNGTIINGNWEEPYYTVGITADWVNISGFYIHPCIEGIYLYYSNYCTISGNNIVHTGVASGIIIWHSNNNTITDNNISDNEESGIQLGYSFYNIISKNKLTGNNDFGILLTGSDYNTITGNNVSSNVMGNIILSNSNNNIISDNNASYDDCSTSILLSNSSYNTIMSNILLNNYEGIGLSVTSNHNTIYNNFLGNINYIGWRYANDYGNNFWNISKTPGTNIIGGPYLGGNFWSNYTGVDVDGDSLGGTPYNIPGGSNQDIYPLIRL